MSHLLHSALDHQRRADCARNDMLMAQGAPDAFHDSDFEPEFDTSMHRVCERQGRDCEECRQDTISSLRGAGLGLRDLGWIIALGLAAALVLKSIGLLP